MRPWFLDLQGLWERLQRCGRLPVELPPDDTEAVLRSWLGDYCGALAACADPGLQAALAQLIDVLPWAEGQSVAFRPRQLAVEQRVNDFECTCLECCTYQASDGTKLGYVFASSADVSQTPCIAEPAVVLHWGGNAELAWHAAQPGSALRNLVDSKIARVFFLDYRGFGWSGGTPSLAAFRNDAEEFCKALPELLTSKSLRWPPSGPLVLVGRSLGAHIALHLALLLGPAVQGVVLDAPSSCHWPLEHVPPGCWATLASQLPTLRAAGRALVHCPCCHAGQKAQGVREIAWLDPLDLVSCIRQPLLLLAGTGDRVCPKVQAEILFAIAQSRAKKAVWFEGRGHNDLEDDAAYEIALGNFLKQLVQTSWELED